MPFVHEKLIGLDRERLLAIVEPVLRAHHVSGVEIIWRTDHRGRVLYLTIERPDSPEPGAGITLDLCADLSRDLSAALDVADVVDGAYRLEVGSPGVERKLYTKAEYERFAGRTVKVKCREAVAGDVVLRGLLSGTDSQGKILVDTDRGVVALEFEQILSGQLVLDLGPGGVAPARGRTGARKKTAARR
jgi:ribosome maturation factor RimP